MSIDLMMKRMTMAAICGAGLRLGWEAFGSLGWLIERAARTAIHKMEMRRLRKLYGED